MSVLGRLLNIGFCVHARRTHIKISCISPTATVCAVSPAINHFAEINTIHTMNESSTVPRSLPDRLLKLQHYWTELEKVPGLDLDKEWSTESLLLFVRSRLSHIPGLIPRDFHSVSQSDETDGQQQKTGNYKFRLMQWNTLAQGLCTGRDNFVKCPAAAMNWETRRMRLLEEILVADPDIVCLQEVDHYAFTGPAMEAVGYSGVFFPKPDSPALYVDETKGPDGCAIFVKKDKFETIKADMVVLKDKGGRFTNQVSVICKLRPKDTRVNNREFYVATTHLKAKNGWDKLRHEQGSYLLEYLQKKVGAYPLIVTGDFNAEKTEPVYKEFSHSPMGLVSAYILGSKDGDEPPYTTWKYRGYGDELVEVCRTLDYVWFRKKDFSVSALREIPEKLGENLLPSLEYPSDHLSLCVDFQFS